MTITDGFMFGLGRVLAEIAVIAAIVLTGVGVLGLIYLALDFRNRK